MPQNDIRTGMQIIRIRNAWHAKTMLLIFQQSYVWLKLVILWNTSPWTTPGYLKSYIKIVKWILPKKWRKMKGTFSNTTQNSFNRKDIKNSSDCLKSLLIVENWLQENFWENIITRITLTIKIQEIQNILTPTDINNFFKDCLAFYLLEETRVQKQMKVLSLQMTPVQPSKTNISVHQFHFKSNTVKTGQS